MVTISQYLSYFKDKRLINVFAFGIASGFPWVLIGSVMSAWLKDEGLSRSMIGLFGVVFACYSVNFLWSPLVDRLKLPLLQKLFWATSQLDFTEPVVYLARNPVLNPS